MPTMYSMIASNPKGFTDEALSRSTFVATNPTPGTGIAMQDDSVARSAVLAMMNVFNSADSLLNEFYVIIPVWLKLQASAANTTADDGSLDIYLDQVDRYTSGGTTITPQALIQSAEADFVDPTTKATINFGELVTAGATDENLVAHVNVATAVLTVDDLIELYWGDAPGSGGRDGTLVRGPGSFSVPPMWIRAGANMSLHWYGANQAADPGFEFEFFYVEKPNANSTS